MAESSPTRIHWPRLLRAILIALGLLIAVAGAAIDYLLPNTSPGVNLPQLLLVFVGVALTLAGLLLRRTSILAKGKDSQRRKLFVGLIVLLATFVVLEIALAALGFPTYFPSEVNPGEFRHYDNYTCNEFGCRIYYDADHAKCQDAASLNRSCIINAHGFVDTDEFVAREEFRDRPRLLMMGDSFTAGYSADYGKSYVESLEASLPQTVIWNTAVSGTGTNQDLAAFLRFAPLLDPDLSILGFFMNDFRDNLHVPGNWTLLTDDENGKHWVELYRFDRWGNAVDEYREADFPYLVHGVRPPTYEIERIAGLTRLGTLALRGLDMLHGAQVDASWREQLRVTRQYLSLLRDAAYEQGSALLVLLIPEREGIKPPGQQYRAAIGLMHELKIPFMDPVDLLDPLADYKPLPDNHWNNAGHQKVGAVLGECVATFLASGSLEDCEYVIIGSD